MSVSRHFLLQAPQCPCSVRKRFSRDHCCRGRSKPGCHLVAVLTKPMTLNSFRLSLTNNLMFSASNWLPAFTYTVLTIESVYFSACVRSTMLHGSETWAPNASDLQRLRRNNRAMIRWICGAKLEDEISSAVLLQKLDLDEITAVLRTRRLRWYGHV